MSTIISSHSTNVQSPPTRRGNKRVVWLWADYLGDMPLVVLTAGDGPYRQFSPELAAPATQAWAELQGELADLSSNSIHRVIAGATHESLVYNQEDAQSTIAAILEVVETVRTGQPLTQ